MREKKCLRNLYHHTGPYRSRVDFKQIRRYRTVGTEVGRVALTCGPQQEQEPGPGGESVRSRGRTGWDRRTHLPGHDSPALRNRRWDNPVSNTFERK